MNVLNFVFIGLIFLSLAVIIFIFGKNIKRIKEMSLRGDKIGEKKFSEKKNIFRRIIGTVGQWIKNIFVFTAEWLVQYIKKLLHLVHFWLIKLKKGGNGKGNLNEVAAKRELLDEEQKNLSTVIHDNLGSDEDDGLEVKFVSKSLAAEQHEYRKKIESEINESEKFEPRGELIDREKKSKLENFFAKGQPSKDTIEEVDDLVADELSESKEIGKFEENESQQAQEEKNKGFFKRYFAKFFKKEMDGDHFEQASDPIDYNQSFLQNDFSDGVVKVEKNSVSGEVLMNEVVTSQNRKFETDVDEDLGVDRKILEKKILQKIAKDPKNIENYRQLGELYIKMKNYQDAMDTYKYILRTTPRDADAKRKTEKIKLLKRIN